VYGFVVAWSATPLRHTPSLLLQGLMVILDNHSSDAMWCCNLEDGNGLWCVAAAAGAVVTAAAAAAAFGAPAMFCIHSSSCSNPHVISWMHHRPQQQQ
jgi:hypothetical protein